MSRYFCQLSYDGAPFNGWQIQPDRPSVQQHIQDALHTITHLRIPVTGAGRTDTGVHAHTMIAHLDLPDIYDDPYRREGLRRALCGLCRPAIAIQALTPVKDNAHARFDATQRTYRYYAHTVEDPFMTRRSWLAPASLDFEAMNHAASLIIGRHDFTSFAKLHTDTHTNICDLRHAQWHRISPSRWYFSITADRFLRNMVRATVGTLVEIGRHKMRPEQIIDILQAMDRRAAGTSMPAHALYLWDIRYPYFEPITL